jgi:hypothetical protein
MSSHVYMYIVLINNVVMPVSCSMVCARVVPRWFEDSSRVLVQPCAGFFWLKQHKESKPWSRVPSRTASDGRSFWRWMAKGPRPIFGRCKMTRLANAPLAWWLHLRLWSAPARVRRPSSTPFGSIGCRTGGLNPCICFLQLQVLDVWRGVIMGLRCVCLLWRRTLICI